MQLPVDDMDLAEGDLDVPNDETAELRRERGTELRQDPVYGILVAGHRLLSKADERRLADVIAEGRRAESEPVPADPQLARERQTRIDAGRAARDEMLLANVRLVGSFARRWAGRGVPEADLVQEGMIALMRAVERFDGTLGWRFSTYATWWIRQAIHRCVLESGRAIRLPIHAQETLSHIRRACTELGIQGDTADEQMQISEKTGIPVDQILFFLRCSEELTPLSIDRALSTGESNEDSPTLERALADPNAEDLDEFATQDARKAAIRVALEVLNESDREVVELYYGLRDGQPGAMNMTEIGRQRGVSQEKIRSILDSAFRQIRDPKRLQRVAEVADWPRRGNLVPA